MKILLATAYEYPHIGGLSTHVATLKAGLEARGHEVDVLSFSNIHPAVRKLYAQGPSFVMNKLKKGRGILWTHHVRKNCLKALIEKNKYKYYDIINAQDPFSTLAALETGIPVVSTVHGYATFESISKGSMRKAVQKRRNFKGLKFRLIKGHEKLSRLISA